MKKNKPGEPKETESKPYYSLAQEEYDTLCANFYQVQSLARITGQFASQNMTPSDQDMLDVSNAFTIIEKNLKAVESLLGK